ncbi:Hypothetical protein CINCED_3A008634 [Cinara cedri]|uniref:Uncharacterized protein n=1 Tax=Cinara cedri TaxID=506608 RepID=A0A5E4M6D2_9HEMI|nr:Hypothetical protein CINCED_3A008634 [Cinara cedri]
MRKLQRLVLRRFTLDLTNKRLLSVTNMDLWNTICCVVVPASPTLKLFNATSTSLSVLPSQLTIISGTILSTVILTITSTQINTFARKRETSLLTGSTEKSSSKSNT